MLTRMKDEITRSCRKLRPARPKFLNKLIVLIEAQAKCSLIETQILMAKKNYSPLTQLGKKSPFSSRYFNYFKLLFCYILPTMTGVWLWGENWRCAVAWQCFIRYISVFHSELTVNSLAHTFGYKPYNK